MLNLMRNVLLNIHTDTQAAKVSSELQEIIPPEFVPLRYSPSVERVRNALLPGVTLDEQAFATARLVQLLHSHPVQVYLRSIENVFSFAPLGTEENFSGELTYDLVTVDGRLQIALGMSKFLRETRRTVSDPVWLGLERISSAAKGPLDRVAVIAVLFELHAAKLLGKIIP